MARGGLAPEENAGFSYFRTSIGGRGFRAVNRSSAFRRLAVCPFRNTRCSAAHSVGQRMDFHKLLVIIDLVRSALSVVPLSIVRGVSFSLPPPTFWQKAHEGRRTYSSFDLSIPPLGSVKAFWWVQNEWRSSRKALGKFPSRTSSLIPCSRG
jgi:hypothetical protein